MMIKKITWYISLVAFIFLICFLLLIGLLSDGTATAGIVLSTMFSGLNILFPLSIILFGINTFWKENRFSLYIAIVAAVLFLITLLR